MRNGAAGLNPRRHDECAWAACPQVCAPLLAETCSAYHWLMDLDWGSVPAWVGGMATALALVFAGVQIRLSRIERHEDELVRQAAVRDDRVANAKAVSVRCSFDAIEGHGAASDANEVSAFHVQWTLTNGGRFPIWQTVLVLGDTGTSPESWADQAGTAYELVLGPVAPGETRSGEMDVTFTYEPHYSEFDGLSAVLFSDVWDQHWYWRAPNLVQREQPARNC